MSSEESKEEQAFPVGAIVRRRGQKRWLGEVLREREDKGGRYVEIRSFRNGGIMSVAPEGLVAKKWRSQRRRRSNGSTSGSALT